MNQWHSERSINRPHLDFRCFRFETMRLYNESTRLVTELKKRDDNGTLHLDESNIKRKEKNRNVEPALEFQE